MGTRSSSWFEFFFFSVKLFPSWKNKNINSIKKIECAPNGESYSEILERTKYVVDELKQLEGEHIVVICINFSFFFFQKIFI